MQPLKVNFTDREASSTVREIPPSGEYFCSITEGEVKLVNPSRKNAGKPFWQLKFVIQAGPYAGSTLMGSIMLFDEALYSLSQLMKALGYDVNEGDFVVPSLEAIIGKEVNVRGFKRPAETKDGRELNERFEIKGYKAPTQSFTKETRNASLLP